MDVGKERERERERERDYFCTQASDGWSRLYILVRTSNQARTMQQEDGIAVFRRTQRYLVLMYCIHTLTRHARVPN